ncbi:TRAP transporter substrate-binding protein [Pontitalea aquivivens]|uniref:TRAP transporter substrate-binding protein n=1 Tax=Pontitalea aquivivens TaxID=3388663 RepID=UPI003970F9FF
MTRFSKIGVIAGLALSVSALAAQAQEVALRYSNWLPAGYPLDVQVMEPWFAEIERVTEGRVKVKKTPKVVGSVAQQYDVVADGLADMSLFVTGFNPGRFPLIEGLELPFFSEDEAKRGPAVWRTYEKYMAPLNIFEEVVPLTVYQTGVYHIFTTGKELSSIEAFKGAKIRSSNESLTAMLELLGATPVSKPTSEVYELAAGGVIDGATNPPDATIGFKLNEVFKRMTYFPGGMSSATVLVSVNPDAWAKISEADQKAILEISGEKIAKASGDLHVGETQKAVEKMEAEGMKIDRISAEEEAKMKEVLAPVTASWAEKAKAAGLENPQEMLDFFAAEIAAAN